MTTFAQLDKQAAKLFCDKMRRRGFAVEKKFTFWRKRGPLFDMFWSRILGGGELLRVYVTIWSPWVDSLEGEFKEFPPESSLIGGTLSDEFPEAMYGGEVFEIENEEKMNDSFEKLIRLIDRCALPWFESINSYDAYSAYVGASGFELTEEWKEQIRRGIARGFELERFR
jgi:hypothetical protein